MVILNYLEDRAREFDTVHVTRKVTSHSNASEQALVVIVQVYVYVSTQKHRNALTPLLEAPLYTPWHKQSNHDNTRHQSNDKNIHNFS